MNHALESVSRRAVATIRGGLLLASAILLLMSAPISAQTGFTLTSPTEGSLVPAGQPITVTWTTPTVSFTGGPISANVQVVLIDVDGNTVVEVYEVTPNSGSRVVTLGMNRCGRVSRFYVQDIPVSVWGYGPNFTVVCRVPVAIDIKPGSFPNSINLGSNGTTPVAILGSATLDVGNIDADTLTLGTAGVKTVGKTDRLMCSVADVSGDFAGGLEGVPDSFLDLVCHFVTVNIIPEAGSAVAKVMGDFIGGGGFEGADSVNIVP
jgi:hypothetical protein